MYGRITRFHANLGVGIIEGENARKYRFKRAEVLNRRQGLVGNDVAFVIVNGRPSDIIIMAGTPWTAFGPAAN